jgi:hypothetical protein
VDIQTMMEAMFVMMIMVVAMGMIKRFVIMMTRGSISF